MSDLFKSPNKLPEPPEESPLPPELAKVLKEFIAARKKEAAESNKEDLLKDLLKSFQTESRFQVGDLVKWKSGLKDRQHPTLNQPAIVVEVLGEPIIDPTTEAGSPYFRDRYDLICGVVIDGNFITYHFNSARLEAFSK